ncbi:MAG TPA: 30S ribosomal protein S11, partial [Planctomycetes bacterium]|nr:30S ribosomal protein S11 [Planctomycetota bacterium]
MATRGGSQKKKKARKGVSKAIVHIKATFNNTIITITDTNGETLCWDSSGTIGYKGSRKSTPFAAQRAAIRAADKARKMGVREVEIRVKGPGSGRESAIRSIADTGLDVKAITDVTPLP